MDKQPRTKPAQIAILQAASDLTREERFFGLSEEEILSHLMNTTGGSVSPETARQTAHYLFALKIEWVG